VTLRVLVVLLLVATTAHAQTEEDVHAAAAAFEEAQRAQLRGDFAQAAELFELADRSSPSPAALRSAIRNHRVASQPARAATLAAEAQTRYPDDAETSALAAETLTALAATLARIAIRCDAPCSATLDARAVLDHPVAAYDLFVEPGTHTIVATWHGAGAERRTVDAHAGEEITIELTPPAAVATAEPGPRPIAPAAPPTPAATPTGVHPALFGTLAGLAVLGVAITIWSGIDTLNAAADYRDDPTHARYDDGVGRELRTNVLTSVSAALAIAAFVTVFFTDWDGVAPAPDDPVALRPSFYAFDTGGGVVLAGRLGT